MNAVFERFQKIRGLATREGEMLSLHTTFGVGGPCDLMAWVSNIDALKQTLAIARSQRLPVSVLGNGSNVLARDGRLPGVVLRLVDELAAIEVAGDEIRAGAGTDLSELVSRAAAGGVGGMEFLAGIPGTVGGAAATNAGAKEVWFGDRLVCLSVIDEDLTSRIVPRDSLNLGYRSSSVSSDWVVTGAVLKGRRCATEEIRKQIEANLERRSQTQPTGELTAGCVFKNPPGESAGRLIDTARLKGVGIGGAKVSTVHANFLVNAGGATAKDILDLIELVRRRVKEVHGVALELEIGIMGEE